MTHAVVWFKRDLRVVDHAPLRQAVSHGPITCVYLIEPSLWASPDAATQHYLFTVESLRDLREDLAALGLKLHVMVGEAVDCLAQIDARQAITALYSHEETGNGLSYARDKAVKQWCLDRCLVWHEYRQFGVTRGRHDRDHWKERWERVMSAPVIGIPTGAIDSGLDVPSASSLPSPRQLGLDPHDPPLRQRGGRAQASQTLQAFLQERSAQYRGGISSPLSAPTACSRLSVYLTYGCLSMREVFQASTQHIRQLGAAEARQARGLQSFVSRLYWHCHFIQKLEDEPAIEWQNMHRGYDDLREDWQALHFERLKEANTGWPMVDACVHMLRETGWLNFRMRAMLVSVAAYPLWLDWRPVGHWLATQFLDYEPGIHWSQMQMQSGTTGINVPRIYNPIKQAQDHDSRGVFVRRWIPVMNNVPDAWLFEPWRMPASVREAHGISTQELPAPAVDLVLATRSAKSLLFARRQQPRVREGKAAIVKKHGSRKRLDSTTNRRRPATPKNQLTLDL